MIVIGSLLFATQPLFQQGPGLSRLFVLPGPTDWPAGNLNRTHQEEPRRDGG
jgi:hypothetical protein